MLNASSIYRMLGIVCIAYFAKDTEDWFGYGKLNVFLSYKCLMLK